MKISVIHCGYFKLDGGAMFGIVPRRMWSKLNPPDENNMCNWSLQCLLVEIGDRKILIDTGMGNKQDAKFRAHFLPHGSETLLGSLAQKNVMPDDITDVFLTHLHFDHCGGAMMRDEVSGEVALTFPNAVYWSNKKHFDWAIHPNAREKASFLQENFLPLYQSGKMRFIDTKQNIPFAAGFKVRFYNGHTEALMAPVLTIGDKTLIYCADALPSQWHIGMPYVMAFDIRPLVSLKEKEKMLEEAVKKHQVLFFEHDPIADCGTVRKDESGRIVLDKVGRLREVLDTV